MPDDQNSNKKQADVSSSETTPAPAPEAASQPGHLSTRAQAEQAVSNAASQKDSLASEPSLNSAISPPTRSADDSTNRNALLEQARTFLRSPHVAYEPLDAKRHFLLEKGLRENEIEHLLREIPPAIPPIPARTYPQLPPSNLPNMLLGLARILSWLTGGSAALLFIYYKFLLPRLTHSALARRAIKQHQASLLKRLSESLHSLKASQEEAFSVLPPPIRLYESPSLAEKHTLESLELDPDASIQIPEFTVLRCAIESLSAISGEGPTGDELFMLLREKIPWLTTEAGANFEAKLWDVLNTNECFSQTESSGRQVWTYAPLSPAPQSPTPLLTALSSLKHAFPASSKAKDALKTNESRFHHTFQALADFVGYITTQTYALNEGIGRASAYAMRYPIYGTGYGANGGDAKDARGFGIDAQQEEIRKEIRALKGLVLNRRTFVFNNSSTPMPSMHVT